MSNDYRNNGNDRGWYYSEGKRYVPQHMIDEERRRRDHGDPRRRPQRYDSRPHRSYPERSGRSASPRRCQEYYPEYENAQKHNSAGLDRSGRAARNVFVCSLLILLLLLSALGGAYFYVNQNIISRIAFAGDSHAAVGNAVIGWDGDYSGQLPQPLSAEELAALEQRVSAAAADVGSLARQEGVTNVLVLCADNRGYSSTDASCDITLLLSVNESTERVVLTLLRRDCLVAIPGQSRADRLCTAYAIGGAALAVSTVETNFGVDIDRYAVIDLYAFRNIIDALGGLHLNITDAERQIMNSRIEEINGKLGLHADSGKLFKVGGSILLSGKQTLGYMRVSCTDSGGMTRAERQITVLEKTISKYRSAGFSAKLDAVEALAANMTTDYSRSEMFSLLLSSFDYAGYILAGSVLPSDGTWSYVNADGTAVIDYDTAAARAELANAIFNN